MQAITLYEARNGRQFSTPGECAVYERVLDDTFAANALLAGGAHLLKVFVRANAHRPWWDKGLTLRDKILLIRATKETKLCVPDWGRAGPAVYCPTEFRQTGEVWMERLAVSWDVSGGAWIGLPRLLDILRMNFPGEDLETQQGKS